MRELTRQATTVSESSSSNATASSSADEEVTPEEAAGPEPAASKRAAEAEAEDEGGGETEAEARAEAEAGGEDESKPNPASAFEPGTTTDHPQPDEAVDELEPGKPVGKSEPELAPKGRPRPLPGFLSSLSPTSKPTIADGEEGVGEQEETPAAPSRAVPPSFPPPSPAATDERSSNAVTIKSSASPSTAPACSTRRWS